MRYQQAQVLAQWGQLDTAIARLQQARAIGDSGLVYARNDPLLDPLRGDPRFAGSEEHWLRIVSSQPRGWDAGLPSTKNSIGEGT